MLEPALRQHEELGGKRARGATVDRGYKGKTMIGGTEILIPKPFNNKKLSKYKQAKFRRFFKRRDYKIYLVIQSRTCGTLG